ncbi:hypothetical protein SAMN05428978_109012 [Nitrosomonas sp. Nm34]|nr:hypothetical protein SAMN05428978_109012 [Nitrosomonas sp. Nm34]
MLFIFLISEIDERINNIPLLYYIYHSCIDELIPAKIPHWAKEILFIISLVFRYKIWVEDNPKEDHKND